MDHNKGNKFDLSDTKEEIENVTASSSTNNQNLQRNRIEIDSSVSKPPEYEKKDLDNAPKRALMVTEPHASEYRMTYPRRGKAVIFNHEHFDGTDEEKEEKQRKGTKMDVERITEVFGNLLQFEIEVYDDLDYGDIIKELKRLSKEDYTNCDCIAIFVLSHGMNGEVEAKDMNYPVNIIWKHFNADHCLTLVGKPKLFFISACRGNKMDKGISLYQRRIENDSSKKEISYKLPKEADILIANSTVEEYCSYRNIETGSWFIECLCDVLTEHYETKDLMKMLTITSRKIAMDYRVRLHDILDLKKRPVVPVPENYELTQIPSIITMLIRDVFFHKKETK